MPDDSASPPADALATSPVRRAAIALSRWSWLALVVMGVAQALFVGTKFRAVASGADSAGYLNSARLLSEGALATPVRSLPEFPTETLWPYTPLGFVGEGASGLLKPTYPVGLPLHDALAAKVAGWEAGPLAVSLAALLGATMLGHACLRLAGVRPELSLAGAVAIGASPLMLYMSLVPMSDVLATAWCAASFVAAWRSRKVRSPRWALLSGLAFSVAVLVRPTNALLLPSIALLLPSGRSALAAAVGAAPGAGFFAWYNAALYGSVLKTGYGSILGAFSLSNVGPSLANYAATFPWVLPLTFLSLALAAFLPWRERPREMAALAVFAFGLPAFYAAYDFTPQAWWFLRFLLPAFPALAAVALLGVQGLENRLRWGHALTWRAVVAGGLAAVSLAASVHWTRARMIVYFGTDQLPYAEASDWGRQHVPAGAAVICMQMSGALYFYTDFPTVRWDQLKPDEGAGFRRALAASGRPVYAALFDFEEAEAFQKLPGRWTQLATFRSTHWWRYDGERAP